MLDEGGLRCTRLTHVIRIVLGDVLGMALQPLFHLLSGVLIVLLTGIVRLLSCSDALAAATGNSWSLVGNISLDRMLVDSRGVLHSGGDAILGRQVTDNLVFSAQDLLSVFSSNAFRVRIELLLGRLDHLVQVLFKVRQFESR